MKTKDAFPGKFGSGGYDTSGEECKRGQGLGRGTGQKNSQDVPFSFRHRYAILIIKNGKSDTARSGKTMSQYEKLLLAILSGTKDKNFLFSDLRLMLERLDFQCRIKGDHFIYTKVGIEEIINIQPMGNMAKPYQVKQVRSVILKYQLGGSVYEI